MFIFKHGGRRAVQSFASTSIRGSRYYASKIEIPFTPPPVPVIEACPSPTCPCRETPSGLDIERESNISGSMASYAEQVLICTGRDDWKSKIEDDEDAVLVRQLKGFLTRGGKYQDPFHNVMITNSSFTTSTASPTESERYTQPSSTERSIPVARPGKDPDIVSQSTPSGPPASAFLLPSFQHVPSIPTESSAVESFIKGFLLPQELHSQHAQLTREQQKALLRQPEFQRQFVGVRPVDEILVLICGHGARDDRCGILGPLLREEFQEKLERQNISVLRDSSGERSESSSLPPARVGLISHIGGHKWAGNVIVYIPPSFHGNPLAGKGIWYGRVGPEHVEGVVGKTIMDGKVIKNLFRGGISQSGEIIRL